MSNKLGGFEECDLSELSNVVGGHGPMHHHHRKQHGHHGHGGHRGRHGGMGSGGGDFGGTVESAVAPPGGSDGGGDV